MKKTASPFARALVPFAIIASMGAGAIVRDRLEVGVPASPPGSLAEKALFASKDDAPSIPESDYFYRISELLRNEFVDPVTDEQKLALGAVKGMVNSLVDPLAVFMGAEQFSAYRSSLRGEFQGIGIETRFEFDREQFKKLQAGDKSIDPASLVPKLVVATVVPNSPAQKAGIMAGDRIDAVNGKWVLSTAKILEFRDKSKALRESALPAEELDARLRDLRDKIRGGTTPVKARELLTQGTSGTVSVSWQRGKTVKTATLAKSVTRVAPVALQPDGSLAIRLFAGADSAIAEAVKNKSSLVLDLRNSSQGDFTQIAKVLGLLAPAGAYGEFVTERGGKPVPLTVASGRAQPAKITCLVDGSTRGAAEILALALSSKGSATLKGSATAGERAWLSTTALPEGQGYVIPTGRYRVASGAKGGAK